MTDVSGTFLAQARITSNEVVVLLGALASLMARCDRQLERVRQVAASGEAESLQLEVREAVRTYGVAADLSHLLSDHLVKVTSETAEGMAAAAACIEDAAKLKYIEAQGSAAIAEFAAAERVTVKLTKAAMSNIDVLRQLMIESSLQLDAHEVAQDLLRRLGNTRTGAA